MRPENVPSSIHALDRYGRTLAFRVLTRDEAALAAARLLLADLAAEDIFSARIEHRAPHGAMVEAWTPAQLIAEARR